MSSFKNSKKNDAGNLLPPRRPTLAKYIILAIMLHVVFVIVYIYFTRQRTESRSEQKEPTVKVVPVSPKREIRHHQTKFIRSSSYLSLDRPAAPSRLVNPPLSETESAITPIKGQAQHLQLLSYSNRKESKGLVYNFQSSVKRKLYRAFVVPKRSPPMDGELYLPNEKQVLSANSAVAPTRHNLAPRTQTRTIQAEQILQTMIFSKTSTTPYRGEIGKKKAAATTSLSLPIDIATKLKKTSPSGPLITGNFNSTTQQTSLARRTVGKTVRFEHFEHVKKGSHQSSKLVMQKETQFLESLSNYATLQPVLPQLIDDYLADLIRRLTLPILQRYSEPKVRFLVKNLTYRDLGLESEGTKFLSGLVKAEIKRHDRAELLSPADILRDPQLLITGELWDDSNEIKVHLRLLNPGTGHEISTSDSSFHSRMLPRKMKVQPPAGENLNIIKQVVELMKQNFPRGGDFQVGVWPDKGLDAVYLEGDKLMVYILPEKDAYLHVDYYQIDGKVVHLLPNERKNNFVKGGHAYIVGDPASSGYQFVVDAPFGEEVLVVVASQQPIGIMAQELIEPAEPYIKQLTNLLARQRSNVQMAGTHYIVLTQARKSEY